MVAIAVNTELDEAIKAVREDPALKDNPKIAVLWVSLNQIFADVLAYVKLQDEDEADDADTALDEIQQKVLQSQLALDISDETIVLAGGKTLEDLQRAAPKGWDAAG